MRTFATGLALALLAAPGLLPAQSYAIGINDQPMGVTNTTSSPNVLAFRHVFQGPMVIVACEFLCGSTKGTGSVYIFDHDPVLDRPGALLARGTFNAPATRCWAGAVLDKPVIVPQPNETRWLGWIMSAGGPTPTIGRTSTAPTYYWTSNTALTPPISWNGPYQGYEWMYRLYGPGGSGKTNVYGQGKAGTYGVPALELWGWPNLGNPLTLNASNLVEGSGGVLVFGGRVDIPLPIGPIYAFPPFLTLGFTTPGSTKPVAQVVPFLFKVPSDPALLGQPLAWQVWMVDPGAVGGVCATGGLEVVIG